MGMAAVPVPRFRITCQTEAKSTPQQNPCSRPSHRGLVASNVVKTFPLREAAVTHNFIGGRKTTGSIVMLAFE